MTIALIALAALSLVLAVLWAEWRVSDWRADNALTRLNDWRWVRHARAKTRHASPPPARLASESETSEGLRPLPWSPRGGSRGLTSSQLQQTKGCRKSEKPPPRGRGLSAVG
jgi:hypothetical protein